MLIMILSCYKLNKRHSMEKPFMITFFFLIILLVHLSRISVAKHNQITTIPLVFGLKHSRASLLIPKLSADVDPSSKKQPLKMIEPLREVRDGYLISLYLGTPPQVIQLYLDTGSDLTWVPCGNLSFDCIDCDDYYRTNKLITTFSPLRSSSSIRDLCSSSYCINIHSSDNSFDQCTIAGCSLTTLLKTTCSRPCPSFAYTYGGGGVVIGTLARDKLIIHETTSNDILKREIPDFCFGCVGSAYKEPIGIVGFGKGLFSLPSQLGFLQKGFSHCFLPFKFANNPNISSPLVIGDTDISTVDQEQMQFTPMLKNPIFPNYYYVGLEAVSVGNFSVTQVPLSLKEFDSQGNGGMLIDSGTTYTHLPQPFYSQLLSMLQLVVSYPRAKDIERKSGFDLCYKVPCIKINNNNACHIEEQFPSITLHFLNNVTVKVSEGRHFYAMGAPQNSSVVKCLLFQSMDNNSAGDFGPAGVFGSFQQQNVKVVYDLEKERIGFQAMDCASFATSQGIRQ